MPDVLEIKFNDPSLFTGKNGLKITHEAQVLRKNLPPQMALDGLDANFVKTLNKVAETIKVVTVGNFILNLLMS